MQFKLSYYLNKITGEVLNNRDLRKYEDEIILDTSLLQDLKGFKPLIFTKVNQDGNYEGKMIESEKINLDIIQELSKEGFSLSENHSLNIDIPKTFNICQHCLKTLEETKDIIQIKLDDLSNYHTLKQRELKYSIIKICSHCEGRTIITNSKSNFKHTDEINVNEVIITEEIEVPEDHPLFLEGKVRYISFEKIYDLSDLEDINNINNHDAIRSMTKFITMKYLGNIKFKKVSNYFKSKEFEKKYKVKRLLNI